MSWAVREALQSSWSIKMTAVPFNSNDSGRAWSRSVPAINRAGARRGATCRPWRRADRARPRVLAEGRHSRSRCRRPSSIALRSSAGWSRRCDLSRRNRTQVGHGWILISGNLKLRPWRRCHRRWPRRCGRPPLRRIFVEKNRPAWAWRIRQSTISVQTTTVSESGIRSKARYPDVNSCALPPGQAARMSVGRGANATETAPRATLALIDCSPSDTLGPHYGAGNQGALASNPRLFVELEVSQWP